MESSCCFIFCSILFVSFDTVFFGGYPILIRFWLRSFPGASAAPRSSGLEEL